MNKLQTNRVKPRNVLQQFIGSFYSVEDAYVAWLKLLTILSLSPIV